MKKVIACTKNVDFTESTFDFKSVRMSGKTNDNIFWTNHPFPIPMYISPSYYYVFRDHIVDGIKIPTVLEIPKVSLTFDLSLLHLEVPCERVKDLHGLIKSKFLDTVNKWFRQIPSSPDYYVYCPESTLVCCVIFYKFNK